MLTASRAECPKTAAKAGPTWKERLTPSLSDWLFVFLILWLFVVTTPGWERLLEDGDTGWHIRAGELILSTGAAPRSDPFSFTKPGAEWFAWEWLSEVLFAVLHGWFGLKGVVWFSGVLIVAFALLLLRYTLWRGANAMVGLFVTFLAIGAASVHFLARPHIFTMLFLTAALWIVERDLRRPDRAVWLLVPLTALWTNLHGGFLALLVCLGTIAAVRAGEALADAAGRGAKLAQARRYAALTAACGAATLLNPYGWKLHWHILHYLQSDWIKRVVNEFRSPSFRAENVLQYEVLLLGGLMAAGWLVKQRRFVEAVWILLWAHFSLQSARHIPIYAIIAAPILAGELSRLWERWAAGRARNSVWKVLDDFARDLGSGLRRTTLWPAAAAVLLLAVDGPLRWPQDFPSADFPTAIVHRNEELLKGRRIFTDDDWADYLIYLYFPEQRVFADGRTDFYGPEIGDAYIDLMYGGPRWAEVLASYEFDAILTPSKRPLTALLDLDPDWERYDEDEEAVLFVPRGAGRAPAQRRGAVEQARRRRGILRTGANETVLPGRKY